MLENITYALIFGIPLIVYLGIITLLSFLITAGLALSIRSGKLKIPFYWHPRMGILSLLLGVIHGFLALMAYIK